MYKDLYFGDEMQTSILRGVEKTARAVGSTLGPSGRTVLIEQLAGQEPLLTKDGVTVARSITLKDKLENQGATLVKSAAEKTNHEAGDGTTTTSILTYAIADEGYKALNKGINPIQLRNGMNRAMEDALAEFDKLSTPVTEKAQIEAVAAISANNDHHIGNLLADAIEAVGQEGVVTLDNSKTSKDEIILREGMQWMQGYLSQYFCTNLNTGIVELDKCYILIYPYKIERFKDLVPTLDLVNSKLDRKPLLIVCDDFENEELATFIYNYLQGSIKAVVVKCPGFGETKMDRVRDLAVVVGATVIDKDVELDLSKVTEDMLGFANKVKISADVTEIIDGYGDPDAIEERAEELKRQIAEAKADYEIEQLRDRLAKIVGGVAIIKLGATTEVELKEKKHRVEDAICSTRSAIKEGILPGGGTTMCQTAYKLSKNIPEDLLPDEKVGYTILLKALERPLRQIAENGGLSGDVLVDKCQQSEQGIGFDAYKGVWCSMLENGIVDPTIVSKESLKNAVSVAALILTSACAITLELDKDEQESIAAMMKGGR